MSPLRQSNQAFLTSRMFDGIELSKSQIGSDLHEKKYESPKALAVREKGQSSKLDTILQGEFCNLTTPFAFPRNEVDRKIDVFAALKRSLNQLR